MIMTDGHWWSFIGYDETQDRPAVSRALLARVAGYGRPYALRIALMLVTILLVTLVSLVPPLLYRDLIDNALPRHDFFRLNLLALGMVGIPLLNGLLGVAQRYLGSYVGESIICDLRRQLFAHMQRMSLRFFTHTKTGELMSRLNNDVVGAQQAITSTMVNILSNAIALVATLAIMLSLEWRLTLISIAILPLFILPARRVGRLLRDVTRQSLNLNARMNTLMNETLNVSGALLVKLFGRWSMENERFSQRATAVRDVGVRSALIGRWFFMGLGLVSAIGTALVFWLGGWLVMRGQFTVGTIVAFGAYLTQLYGPLAALTNARVEFATSLVSFERVFEVLDLPVEIRERPGALSLDRVRGEVRFDDVSFSYGNAEAQPTGLDSVKRWRWSAGAGEEEPLSAVEARRNGPQAEAVLEPPPAAPRWALEHVGFSVQSGQLAALVGPSGAGKTTVTYLLPRLYDPVEGRVLVDGHDLRDLTLESLSRAIGMVTQETYLFHDTLRANLLYARPDATQTQIEEACRIANIDEFIDELPQGYETVVGERGYRLSGGEKQRVAIARVVLKDPRILVLDEATSHLDSRSEALIQAALERVMRGRTSIVIAHRLSTVLAADVILVMDHGRLVERGTHAELLARGGLYATLYDTQFRTQPAARRARSSTLRGTSPARGS